MEYSLMLKRYTTANNHMSITYFQTNVPIVVMEQKNVFLFSLTNYILFNFWITTYQST